MRLRTWFGLLALQLFGVFWAVWMFSSPISRNAAGLAAGVVFLIVASAPLIILKNNPQRSRWVVFWAALIFLIFSALPILGLRIIFWGETFSQIEVAGMRAANLHSWSESIYLGMVIGTLWDGFRNFFLKKVHRTKKGA